MSHDADTTRFLASTSVALDAAAPAGAVGILGVPYDGAVTYRGGASEGPAEIRAASDSIESYCPRLDLDLEDGPVVDLGDLELATEGNGEARMAFLSAQLERAPSMAELPLVALGGDHLVAYPFLRRALATHPDLAIFHIDAHTDLRESWEGEPFNHATVLRRALDLMSPQQSLWSWGIRSGLRTEFELARSDARIRLIENTAQAGFEAIDALVRSGRPVYLTIDVDGIDPADIPGTGTPEPAGLRYADVEEALLRLVRPVGRRDDGPIRPARFVGADVVELAPGLDPTGRSNVAVARLVRTLLLGLRACAAAHA